MGTSEVPTEGGEGKEGARRERRGQCAGGEETLNRRRGKGGSQSRYLGYCCHVCATRRVRWVEGRGWGEGKGVRIGPKSAEEEGEWEGQWGDLKLRRGGEGRAHGLVGRTSTASHDSACML
ncbi:hypothetical protein Naga_100902g4 [Nannochloropsis gaditana]|uniref:Uncharacterized protein n=1 Tax=Nannochloropsis gaditana TaxID=72520 RepID=W7TBQ0_9STRA|nr:hypothetical protein Naga_100902g4 [Nannochloropsis gaditana]